MRAHPPGRSHGATAKRRCTGHRTDGQPCRAWAMHGQEVCWSHGGAAKQNRRAGKRKQALAKAERMVALSGVDMNPIDHLLDSLHRAATLVRVWGIMFAALDDAGEREAEADGRLRGELDYYVADDESGDELRVASAERLLGFNTAGAARIHPFAVQYEQALERRARFAKMCLDAGVSERQIALVERMAEQLATLFERTLRAVKGLSAEQRAEAAEAYAREISQLERPASDRIPELPSARGRTSTAAWACRDAGVRVADVAALIPAQPATVRRWLRGTLRPSPKLAGALAQLAGPDAAGRIMALIPPSKHRAG